MFFLSDVIIPGGDFCHVDERTVILETREQAFFSAHSQKLKTEFLRRPTRAIHGTAAPSK